MNTFRYAKIRNLADDAEAMARIRRAASMIETAHTDPEAISAGKVELSRAVLAAHDLGIGWQTIGEALGVARGTAYQRYRRRPGRQRATDRAVSESV